MQCGGYCDSVLSASTCACPARGCIAAVNLTLSRLCSLRVCGTLRLKSLACVVQEEFSLLPALPPDDFYDWMAAHPHVSAQATFPATALPSLDDIVGDAALGQHGACAALPGAGDAAATVPAAAGLQGAPAMGGHGACVADAAGTSSGANGANAGGAAAGADGAASGSAPAAAAPATTSGGHIGGADSIWSANVGGQIGTPLDGLMAACKAAHGDSATWSHYKCAARALCLLSRLVSWCASRLPACVSAQWHPVRLATCCSNRLSTAGDACTAVLGSPCPAIKG